MCGTKMDNHQSSNVVSIFSKAIKSDRSKIMASMDAIAMGDNETARSLLSSVSVPYWEIDLHKDLSRALVCYLTIKTTRNPIHIEEANFYLAIYGLVKDHVGPNKIMFRHSGYLEDLKDTLFKDFPL